MNLTKESGVTTGHKWKPETQRSDAALPRKLPRDSTARRSWRLTKIWSQGLMIILAAMGWPSAYPKPVSRVTTTVYD